MTTTSGPVLLCYDGSPDAAAAIATAGVLLAGRRAVVLTAWEPVDSWEPFDPGSIISAPLSRLAEKALDLDEISLELARERAAEGVSLAAEAGFEATALVERGKPWEVVCAAADGQEAASIVVGARGLGRVESVLLGSVSSAVLAHSRRPVLVIPLPGKGGGA